MTLIRCACEQSPIVVQASRLHVLGQARRLRVSGQARRLHHKKRTKLLFGRPFVFFETGNAFRRGS